MFGNYCVRQHQTFIKTKSEPENLETNKSSWFVSKHLHNCLWAPKQHLGKSLLKESFNTFGFPLLNKLALLITKRKVFANFKIIIQK